MMFILKWIILLLLREKAQKLILGLILILIILTRIQNLKKCLMTLCIKTLKCGMKE